MKKLGQVASHQQKALLLLSAKLSNYAQTIELFQGMIDNQARIDIEIYNTVNTPPSLSSSSLFSTLGDEIQKNTSWFQDIQTW